MDRISKIIYRSLGFIMLFISQAVVALAQQPTHYPDEHEPIPPTVINILIFIGGPILLFVIYWHYRKREKKKVEAEASASAKATADREARADEERKKD
ncbi:MAG: hypothetical protein U9N72_11470 [Bacteroidota bacterium]|nr:hypothetical protein [Bacteroidota bacterium]